MSFTAKVMAFALSATMLFACKNASDPKDVSIAFIEHLNARQFDKASVLTTDASRQTVVDLKSEQPPAAPATAVDESLSDVFNLETLQPYISGNKAIVKNNLVSLNLEKVDGDWQVVASKDAVDAILHRTENIANVKAGWETLKKEYINRSVLLREYISYVKNSGRDMPEVTALEEGLKALPTIDAEPTKEKI